MTREEVIKLYTRGERNFIGANLRGANLRGAYLTGADFTGAYLTGSDLTGSDLHGSDLTGSDLHGTIGNMREVFSAQFERWPVSWTSNVLQIGCQRHTISDWMSFDDAKIDSMSEHAFLWWQKWKPVLKLLIETTAGATT